MADQARHNAELLRDRIMKRRDELKVELDMLSGQLDSVTSFLKMLDQYEAMQLETQQARQLAVPAPEPMTRAPRRRPKNPPRDDVVHLVVDILEKVGRPMSRRELFDSVKSTGLVLNGTDPEMVLSTMLWRSQDRIVRLPKLGYWIADRPYPQAEYVPGEAGLDVAAKPSIFD